MTGSKITADLQKQLNNSLSKHKSILKILAVKYALPDELKNRLKFVNIEQQRDAKLRKISEEIRIQDNPKYKIDRNVLYKIIDGQWKIMVPDELVEDLTWACHESFAHAGPYKCYLAMHEDFVWLNMARKVKSILQTCHICQTVKYPNQHTYVEMGNIITKNKNDLVCIDFLGPLPRLSLIHISLTEPVYWVNLT